MEKYRSKFYNVNQMFTQILDSHWNLESYIFTYLGVQLYRDNQKTVDQEDDIIEILKCILCSYKANIVYIVS